MSRLRIEPLRTAERLVETDLPLFQHAQQAYWFRPLRMNVCMTDGIRVAAGKKQLAAWPIVETLHILKELPNRLALLIPNMRSTQSFHLRHSRAVILRSGPNGSPKSRFRSLQTRLGQSLAPIANA